MVFSPDSQLELLDPSTTRSGCGIRGRVQHGARWRATQLGQHGGLLLRWPAGGLWIRRQDGPAVGYADRCGTEHAGGPFRLDRDGGLLTRRPASGFWIRRQDGPAVGYADGCGTEHAGGPLRLGQHGGLLLRWPAGGFWIRRQDGPAVGYADGCGTLEGHSGWGQDGSLLARLPASGFWIDDKTVRLWDTRTGAARGTLEGHSDCVNTVVFSPDGQLVASGSGDGRTADGAPEGGVRRSGCGILKQEILLRLLKDKHLTGCRPYLTARVPM